MEKLSVFRRLSHTLSEEHNESVFWMHYGIIVALRMIEGLWCQGYVILIPNRGRFWAMALKKHRIKKKINPETAYRIAYQSEENYTYPYKRFSDGWYDWMAVRRKTNR